MSSCSAVKIMLQKPNVRIQLLNVWGSDKNEADHKDIFVPCCKNGQVVLIVTQQYHEKENKIH